MTKPRSQRPEDSDDIREAISEAIFSGEDRENIKIIDRHQYNACNFVGSGIVTIDGKEYGFRASVGDWDGFYLSFWGDPEDNPGITKPEPRPTTFVPQRHNFHLEYPGRYLLLYIPMRQSASFKNAEKRLGEAYYDCFFAPGEVSNRRFREVIDWATKNGLEIGHFDPDHEIEARQKIDSKGITVEQAFKEEIGFLCHMAQQLKQILDEEES